MQSNADNVFASLETHDLELTFQGHDRSSVTASMDSRVCFPINVQLHILTYIVKLTISKLGTDNDTRRALHHGKPDELKTEHFSFFCIKFEKNDIRLI